MTLFLVKSSKVKNENYIVNGIISTDAIDYVSEYYGYKKEYLSVYNIKDLLDINDGILTIKL